MIITAPKLLTLQPCMKPIDDGALVIRNGIVKAAGPAITLVKKYPSRHIYPFKNAVLMPGLVNVHTHLELPPLLDVLHAASLPEWIVKLIRAKKGLSRQDYAHAARENIRTLIQSGTTTVGEICTHNVSPPLLKKSGLRAIVFHEIISMGSRIGEPAGRLHIPLGTNTALVKSGLSPHTPYTVSEPVMRQIASIIDQRHLRITMHVAESRDEIRLLQRRKSGLEMLYKHASWDLDRAPKGASSFEYLERIGFLSPRLLAVHSVHVTDGDLLLIKKTKTSVAHCPRSNRKTGAGRMPLRKMLDAGIPVGLGTDSLASSPSLSLWDEMRTALHMHRKSGVTAEDIILLATMGGAKALGLEQEIGSLIPGKKADIIAVPLPRKDTGDLCSDLLRETKTCIMTMVNGRILWGKRPDERS